MESVVAGGGGQGGAVEAVAGGEVGERVAEGAIGGRREGEHDRWKNGLMSNMLKSNVLKSWRRVL